MLGIDQNRKDWIGAQSLPKLVGRKEKLDEIQQIATSARENSHVIFVTGEGGYGKTRVALAAIEQLHAIDGVRINEELIDLYHIHNHTAHGLAKSMVDQFGYENFSDFSIIWDEIQTKIAAGRTVGEDRNRLLETFSSGFADFAKAHDQIIIVLDTAERILYSPLDTENNELLLAETWSWLGQLLGNINNLNLIVAGRPEISPLFTRLPSPVTQTEISLGLFTKKDTLDYFDAVAELFRIHQQPEQAKMIDELSEKVRIKAFYESGGLPILLSLSIDMMAKEGILPSADPKEIIAALKEGGRLGETVVALGRLPKGANPELLAEFLSCTIGEADERLDEVKDLSFVKLRPSDETVFLHDKMYDLLREEVFEFEAEPETDGALRHIEDYYKKQLTGVVNSLKILFEPILESSPKFFKSYELMELSVLRRQALVEYLYYLLQHHPIRGFQHYYRYMREAIHSGDTLLDRELHLTLLEFWRERAHGREHVEGLEKRQILGVSRMRATTQAFAEGDYARAISEAESVRSGLSDEPEHRVRTTRAIANVWEAYSRATRGQAEDIKIARTMLDNAILDMGTYLDEDEGLIADFKRELEGYQKEALQLRRWRATAVLAFAYRVRGYLRRSQQELFEAINDYREASRLWQEVNILIEDAITRNDLGRALGDVDEWDNARDLINEALHIRRDRLGLWLAAALSINTLAVLDVAEDRHSDARIHAQRALSVFGKLEHQRGRALAFGILAEATRRFAISDLAPIDSEAKQHLLREAYELATQASELFGEVDETQRRIKAELEAGCAYRDLLMFDTDKSIKWTTPDRLKRIAIAHLEKAIELASTNNNLYRELDGYVSLLTLTAGLGDMRRFNDAQKRLQEAIPKELLQKQVKLFPLQTQHRELLPQIGKWYALQGHQQMKLHLASETQDWRRKPTDELDQAIKYYVLSIEYHRSFDAERDFRELRKNTTEMHRNIQELWSEERQFVATSLASIEKDYGIESSGLTKILLSRALI